MVKSYALGIHLYKPKSELPVFLEHRLPSITFFIRMKWISVQNLFLSTYESQEQLV